MNQTLRSRIQEDHLTCPICFNRFDKPKALPCLHTFCLGCLNDYIVSRNYDSAGVFPCPVCRVDIPIPPQGIQGFADNHIVASLIDTVEEAKSVPAVPPRPSQTAIDDAHKHHGIAPPQVPTPPQRISPAPGQGLQPPRGMSPTPGHDQGQDPSHPQRLFGSGVHRQYIGKMLSDGIGTAKGVVTNISSYLYPTNPAEPACGNSLTSPYEMVNKPDIPFDGQTASNFNQPPSHGQAAPNYNPPAGYGQTHSNNQPYGDGQAQGVNYPQLYPAITPDNSAAPCTHGLIISLGKYGAGVNDFLKPYGLAAGRNGEIVITDVKGSRVFVYAKTGQLVSRFNIDCEVRGVAVTLDNNLLIAVTKSHSALMRLYAMNGKLLQSIGDFYRYDMASGICVTPKNYVLVSNLAADNILVFTDQRKTSVKFGRKGKGDLHFTQPMFVTSTSKEHIVVSDSGNDCIKLYDITGNFKRTFSKSGEHHGSLNHPLGVATDAEDNVIIADSNNFRVEVFTIKGSFYTTFLENTNLIGPDVKPINVCVTSDNNIAVLLYGTGFAEVRVYSWRPGAGRFQV